MAIAVTLLQDVRKALREDPHVGALPIRVAVTDGIAILEGRVPSPLAHFAARRAAADVDGVRGVVSRLKIEPSEPAAADLAQGRPGTAPPDDRPLPRQPR